jgi:hypothetical protein
MALHLSTSCSPRPRQTSFINDIVVDDTLDVAYISDASGEGAIIVFDLKTKSSHRVTHPSMKCVPRLWGGMCAFRGCGVGCVRSEAVGWDVRVPRLWGGMCAFRGCGVGCVGSEAVGWDVCVPCGKSAPTLCVLTSSWLMNSLARRASKDFSYELDGVDMGKFVIPIDGIALTPDKSTVYYNALSGNRLYSVPAAQLRSFTPGADLAVIDVGEKPASDGLAFGSNGKLYFGSLVGNRCDLFCVC